MKPKANRIPTTCRLDEQDRQELELRAEQANTTVSELVEQYILAGLKEEDARASIVAILLQLREELRETRRDHAVMAAALLAEGGKRSREEGIAWARQHILHF